MFEVGVTVAKRGLTKIKGVADLVRGALKISGIKNPVIKQWRNREKGLSLVILMSNKNTSKAEKFDKNVLKV